MRFVDVTNDIAFRRIFGNRNKTGILISFLNAVLTLEKGRCIREVEIINPYLLPRVAGEKASIIDVRAKDEMGRQFVVEMQVADADGFDKRVQYYTSRDYSMQIERGEQYPLLRATYFIGILGFNFFKGREYLSNHLILDEKTHEHALKDIRFTFIELRKFNKEAEQLDTLAEKWIFFIKNAENLKVIPQNVGDEGLMEAYRDADKHTWKKEELIAYDNASIAEQDARGRLAAARRQGKIEGKTEGKIEGRAEGKLKEKEEVVGRCMEENMPLEMMARVANLSVPEVEEVIQRIKEEI